MSYSDWMIYFPEYKMMAVQVNPSNGLTLWQESYARRS